MRWASTSHQEARRGVCRPPPYCPPFSFLTRAPEEASTSPWAADLALRRRATLCKPLLENRVFVHLQLALRTEPKLGTYLRPCFVLQPPQVLCSQLGFEEIKLQFLCSLLELLQRRQFRVELLVMSLLKLYGE